MHTPLRDRARGRWKSILPQLGIDPRYLTGKNGPCPLCPGGLDRWRFDNKRGDGTWICTYCGAGQGIALALRYTRMPFRELAQRIERAMGDTVPESLPPERPPEVRRARLNALWRGSEPIRDGDAVDHWMINRGIWLETFPACLRLAHRVRHSGPPVSWHPAMLAMVSDPTGRPATIHKTYLAPDGTKAPVDRVRMFCPGSRPEGGAVRLAEHADQLGVAEGVETSLAAAQIFGIPVWSALDAGGLEKFIPPADVRRLVIFGDNDVNGRGQQAAHTLAARLAGKIAVVVKIPDEPGTDWNDRLLKA